ncbi:hypothetical protein [Microbacterium sp. GXF6406]
MANIITDRTFINRAARGSIGLVVVLILFAAGFSALGYANVTGLAKDVSATYAATTGDVISEGTTKVREGGRRSRHWVEYRTVTIEYDVAGLARTSDSIRDEELQIGDRIDIWVETRDGDVFLEKPGAPGFWNWTWAIVVPLIALGLLLSIVLTVRSSIRLKNFDPAGREPDFVFAIDSVDAQQASRRSKKRIFTLQGATEANSIASRIGATGKLVVGEKNLPPVTNFPARLTGYYLTPGAESTDVVLHTPELGDSWWSAVLSFELVLDQQKPAP